MKSILELLTRSSGFILTVFLFLPFVIHLVAAQADYDGSEVVQAAPGQKVIDLILLGASSDTFDVPVKFDVPVNIDFGKLYPAASYSKSGTLVFKGTGHWNIIVSSDGHPNTGYMSEYDTTTSQYIGPNGKQLTNSMKIRAVDEDGTLLGQVDLKNGGQLISGSGNSIKSFIIYFDQVVTWDDAALIQNHIYRSVVTFTLT